MSKSRNDIIAEFTKEITKLNIAFKQYLQSRLRQCDIDLTYEMLQVLGVLWCTDGVNQQEIANITVKDKASMTYLLDNLVKRDLVYRQEDANDRRNKLVFLTKEGKTLKTSMQPLVKEMYTIAGEGVNLDEVNKMLIEIERIRENIRKAAV